MSAWISKVKLRNFKVYENAEFIFPEPKPEGNNLILLGAVSGVGKTSFSEALYLGFYGITKRTEKIIARKDIVFSLDKLLFSEAQPKNNGKYEMSIEIEYAWYEVEEIKKIRIIRTWSFNEDKKYPKEKETFYKWKGNNDWEVFDDKISFFEYTNENLPIEEHSSFFIFDCTNLEHAILNIEEVNKFVNKGLNDLIGISILDVAYGWKSKGDAIKSTTHKGLKQELEKIYNEELKKIEELEKLKTELNELKKKREDKEKERNKTIKLIDTLDNKIKDLEEERNQITNDLGGDYTEGSTKRELLKKKAELETEISKIKKEIQENLKNFSLLFLSNNIVNNFRKEMNAEQKRLDTEQARETIIPNINKFRKELWESDAIQKFFPPLTPEEKIAPYKKEIYKTIEQCFIKIWYPLQEGVAKHIRHNYLGISNHAEIQQTIASRKAPDNEMNVLISRLRDTQHLLIQTEQEINELGDEDKDDLIDRLKELYTLITNNQEKQGVAHTQFININNELKNLDSEINSLYSQTNDSEYKTIQRLSLIIKTINEICKELSKMKIDEFEQNVNEIIKQLMEEEISVRIANSEVEFIASNDEKHPFSLFSGGQKQRLLCALLWGLAKTTGFSAPYVLDSPLKPLSKDYSKDFIKFLASLPYQVILTPLDTEISAEMFNELNQKGWVLESYLITSKELRGAKKRASIEQGSYFKE